MIAMNMVQAAIDEIINVIAMGHCFMSAARSVLMTLIMAGGNLVAGVGVRVAHFNHMLIHMVVMNVV